MTPDILADQTLYEACVDAQGRPTGYAQELWNRYSEHAPTQLLANLGELDWQTPEEQEPLLADVWEAIVRQLRAADAWTREQLIDTIAPAAYFWPEQALALVDVALTSPAEKTDWGLSDVHIDDRSVRTKLPVLLRAVGAHPRYAAAAMDRLWMLARDDTRPTNAFPEHPLRVLSELGGYNAGAEQRNALLDFVERRLADDDVDDYPNSPLPLVGVVLRREGSSTRSSGLAIHFRPHFLDPHKTRGWRERVRRILVEEALGSSRRGRALAAKLFDDALRPAIGQFGVGVSDEIADAWHDDQMHILDAVEQIEQRSDDPLVRLLLRHAVDWHAAHSRWQDFSARARALLDALQGDAAETYAAIASPYDLLDEKEKTERDQRVAARLAAAHPTGADLAEAVEQLLERVAVSTAFEHADPGPVLYWLFTSSPSHAREFFDWVLEHPDARVATAGAVAPTVLRRAGEDITERLRAAWTNDVAVLRRLAADYLNRGAWFDDPQPVELKLLDEMIADDDEIVRSITSTTVLRMRATNPAAAVNASLAARIPAPRPKRRSRHAGSDPCNSACKTAERPVTRGT